MDGVCVAAGARDERICFVCDPQRSPSALSLDEGAICGEPEGERFWARTCNSDGACVSRPLEPGTACGSRSASECTEPDSCDGGGFCNSNDASDGTFCENGLLCTEGDSCQGGH